MNKYKKISFLLPALLLAWPLGGHAKEVLPGKEYSKGTPYGRIDLGYAMPTSLGGTSYGKKRPSNSLAYGGGLGWTFNKNVRADLNLAHYNKFKYSHTVRNKKVKQDFDNTALMLNGYFDVAQSSFANAIPYITAGLGGSYNHAKDYVMEGVGTSKGASSLQFAWNVGAGLAFKIERVHLDIGYRYNDFGRANTSKTATARGRLYEVSPVKARLKAHTISAGFRFNF
jgi:opacity protein-like surface antigen